MTTRPTRILLAATLAPLALAACSQAPEQAGDTAPAGQAETSVSEATADTAAATLATGSFSNGDGHATSGTASIVLAADGSHRLVLGEGFSTDGAPDLRVWLSEAPAGDGDAIGDAPRVDLGGLESTDGGQSYAIPAGTDTEALHSAVIWCRAFGVYFGGATLNR